MVVDYEKRNYTYPGLSLSYTISSDEGSLHVQKRNVAKY